MARRSREDHPGSWHHAINQGIARRPMFEGREDIRYFLSRLAREVRRRRIEIHAYCVLPSHFHLLLRSPGGQMSEAMRRAQNEYSRWFNRRNRRDGALIRGRFYSKPVRTLSHRIQLVRYIDANPVRARIVTHSAEYPYCSAAHYSQGGGPPWLDRAWVEQEACRLADRSEYTPAVYALAFDHTSHPRQHEVTDARVRSHGVRDDLDDLIRAAPPRVLAWMRRKARLADGTDVGLPVCDRTSILEVLAEAEREDTHRLAADDNRPTVALTHASVGLLRDLAGLRWPEIAATTSLTVAQVRLSGKKHLESLAEEGPYEARIAELTHLALRRCHG